MSICMFALPGFLVSEGAGCLRIGLDVAFNLWELIPDQVRIRLL